MWSTCGHGSVLLSHEAASAIRLTVLDLQTLAKCPIFLQLLHCALRAGQICSMDQFGFPQKRQFLFDNFLLSLNWFVCPISSVSVELLVESFLAFLVLGFFIAVLSVVIVEFYGLQYQLYFQRALYKIVTGSFVFNCGCKFVRDDFFCRYIPKVTLSLAVHEPLPIFI